MPNRDAPTASRGKFSALVLEWSWVWRALVILVAAFWVFWPSLRGDWLWDDTQLIRDNPLVHDAGGWWKIWLEPGLLIDFQPITTTFFWLEWHLFGTDTLDYHVMNVLLHVAGSLLVWRLFARLGLRAAWVGGLLFAVHPLMVESVAWIAEAKNVLSLPPFLLAVLAWIDFSERGKGKAYWRALGLFLVALLCKATVIMFPVIILLYAWYRRGRIEVSDLRRSGPFFALSLIMGVMTIWFLHRNGAERPELPALGGVFERMAGAGLILGFYLEKCLWPFGLLPVYPQWTVHSFSPVPWLIWAALAVAVLGLWRARRGWGRAGWLGLGFLVINLAPFLGLTAASYMAFTWAMDHVLYLPLIGLIGLVAAGWGELERRVKASLLSLVKSVLALGVLGLAGESHEYARIFLNPETLWTYTLERNPGSWIAHSNLGGALKRHGRRPEALAQDEAAAQLRPGDANLRCNTGELLGEMGRTSEALEEYGKALEIDPRSATAYCNRGVALTQLGRLPEALADYQRALELRPDYAEAHSDLGVALVEMGRPLEAMEHYRAAVGLNPDYAVAHGNLGDLLGETGNYPEALAQYREVLRIDPGDASAHYNSGVALTRLGRGEEAAAEYRAALRIDPGYERARVGLQGLQR